MEEENKFRLTWFVIGAGFCFLFIIIFKPAFIVNTAPCQGYECKFIHEPAKYNGDGENKQCGDVNGLWGNSGDKRYEYSVTNLEEGEGANVTLNINCRTADEEKDRPFSQEEYIKPQGTYKFVIDPNEIGENWCCTFGEIISTKVWGCEKVPV